MRPTGVDMQNKRKTQAGMSLIEIMVVIAIIATVASLVTVNVLDYLDESKVETTKIAISNVEQALKQYKRKIGNYPSGDQGLNALQQAPSDLKDPGKYPQNGFLEKLPKDGWGNEFQYFSPGRGGQEYEVLSLGGDSAEGGEGYDTDISSATGEGEVKEAN